MAALVEFLLPVGQPLFPDVGGLLAPVGELVAFVRQLVAFVRVLLALVCQAVAFVGSQAALGEPPLQRLVVIHGLRSGVVPARASVLDASTGSRLVRD